MWMNLQLSSHQVAIAGQVSDAETGQAIAGAQVWLTQVPPAFQARLALQGLQYGDRWSTLTSRPDRTQTTGDGWFHFLDLPASTYGVSVSLPQAGTRYGQVQQTVTVPSAGSKLSPLAIALPPTALKGKIQNARGEPITMATLRLEGSGEQTWSDDQGNYLLTALEASQSSAGSRTVTVTAQGYTAQSQAMPLKLGTTHTLNFILQR